MRITGIFTKIFLSNAIIGLFSLITISTIFYFLIRNALVDRTLDQLASVNALKADQIDRYLKQADGTRELAIDESFTEIQRMLLDNTGMGSTGESYIVGPDNKLRSASRFFPDRAPHTISTEENAGPDHMRIDYRGKKVLSFSKELSDSSRRWRIVTEIDFDEAMAPIVRFRNYLAIITISCAILVVVVSVFLSNAISRPLQYLQEVMRQLAIGIFPATPVTVSNTDEIGKIAQAVNELVEREIRLVRDKTAALIEGQENERKRLTQELHDGVGQLLTAVRLRIETTPIDPSQRKEIVDLINETIAEVKRISYNVMPGSLVDFGLDAALKGLCDNTARYSSLKFDFRYIHESNHTLNFDVTVAVFRIVQEGINNILKHASAENVELHVVDTDDSVYVLLKDDGKGFDRTERATAGLGLRSMTERAKLLGGTVEIHSNDEGTVVEAQIPLADRTDHTD
jgi:two-component system NarL family sensor kinase